MNFKTIINTIINSTNLSNEEIGSRMDVPVTSVEKMRTGKSVPNVILTDLCRAVDLIGPDETIDRLGAQIIANSLQKTATVTHDSSIDYLFKKYNVTKSNVMMFVGGRLTLSNWSYWDLQAAAQKMGVREHEMRAMAVDITKAKSSSATMNRLYGKYKKKDLTKWSGMPQGYVKNILDDITYGTDEDFISFVSKVDNRGTTLIRERSIMNYAKNGKVPSDCMAEWVATSRMTRSTLSAMFSRRGYSNVDTAKMFGLAAVSTEFMFTKDRTRHKQIRSMMALSDVEYEELLNTKSHTDRTVTVFESIVAHNELSLIDAAMIMNVSMPTMRRIAKEAEIPSLDALMKLNNVISEENGFRTITDRCLQFIKKDALRSFLGNIEEISKVSRVSVDTIQQMASDYTSAKFMDLVNVLPHLENQKMAAYLMNLHQINFYYGKRQEESPTMVEMKEIVNSEYQTFEDAIQKFREENGLRMQDIVKLVKMNKSTFANIRFGRELANKDQAMKIHKVTQIPLDMIPTR